MLVVSDLASAINNALGPPLDAHGMPISVTSQMTAYAQAIIDTLHAGIVSNIPGTITGTAPPASPLVDGEGMDGLMVLEPSIWLADMESGFPSAPPSNLSSESTASTGYLMTNGQISFASGDINGECTATPINAGILAAGSGTDGEIDGLSGSAWATIVLNALGIPSGPKALPIYTAISNYLQTNASAMYAIGTVNGTFAPGGGPLVAGTGAGGTIE
jgi:hypothetical protein